MQLKEYNIIKRRSKEFNKFLYKNVPAEDRPRWKSLRREFWEKRERRLAYSRIPSLLDICERAKFARQDMAKKLAYIQKLGVSPDFWKKFNEREKKDILLFAPAKNSYEAKYVREGIRIAQCRVIADILRRKGFKKGLDSSREGRIIVSRYLERETDGLKVRLSHHNLPLHEERVDRWERFGTWWNIDIVPDITASIAEILREIEEN